jgi:hypothetical protein
MATSTLQVMRREFAHYLGYAEIVGKDGLAWSTTTNIAASALLISTELRDYGFDDIGDAGVGDDVFENHWAIILGTNNAEVVRRLKSYDASAGQLTVTGTNLSSESGTKDFEIHKYSPALLREALNTARLRVHPLLYVPVTRYAFTAVNQARYEVPTALIGKPTAIYLQDGVGSDYANNLLSNPGFETFAGSAFTSWTATTLDIAEETITTSPTNYAVLRDGTSARCTSRTGSVGTLLQNISSPGTHSGQRISLSIWVYCLTSAKVRTQIDINAVSHTGTTADGGEHGGTGWELLTHYEDSLVTLTTLRLGVRVDSDATDNTEFYVDEAIGLAGPVKEPDEIGEKLLRWDYEPVMQGSTLVNEVVFDYNMPDMHRLIFKGRGYLSSVSAETDTMEISQPQTELLYAYAAVELYKRLGQTTPLIEDRKDISRYALALADTERLSSVHSMREPNRPLMIPDWVR